jgi:sulfite reductase (ferredoxin)
MSQTTKTSDDPSSNPSNKPSNKSWKASLGARIPEAWGREIDIFETQIELRKKLKIEEKLFAETRLRRGAYGQRYDNGQRHDGQTTQSIAYPSGEITKGPATMWDAPGMQRIKIPFGRLTCDQLDELAACAEEYSDRILHVTTRQDFQLHFVHIEDTPDLQRRLASVGITTREACGNTVRNVTQCPYAGVCNTEAFDVTPYSNALTFFLLGHDDTQDFGRKFKVAFSGCKESACGVTNFHDLGAIARTRVVDGETKRGFELVVGGGLGAVPQNALVFDEFLPEEELLPISQAMSRVFARLGERANRARARFKFVVKKLGIDETKRLVWEERAKLRPDPRWTAFLADLHATDEKPIRPAGTLPPAYAAGVDPIAFEAWRASNVVPQRQAGYVMATIMLPLGDLTSEQARALADVARKYTGDALRTTVEQNLLLRWVSEADLPAFYEALVKIGLATGGASTISDITACPGTDTCKLGISSSRALAAELTRHIRKSGLDQDPNAKHLHIKASGCFNSCGQHHVADLGFLGVSRNVGGRRVPHFQLVVGGQWTNNAGSYGLAIGAVPSKRVPEIVQRLTERFAKERVGEETFADFANRIGKKTIRAMVEELQAVPTYDQDPSYYSDWGDPREYSISDMAEGECAGEIVPYVEVELASAERELFESHILMDDKKLDDASGRAFSSMLIAARALVKERNANVSTDAGEIVSEFRKLYVDTDLFDPLAAAKFSLYLFRAHEVLSDKNRPAATPDSTHQLIEEATVFIDAAHQCYTRLGAALSGPVNLLKA